MMTSKLGLIAVGVSAATLPVLAQGANVPGNEQRPSSSTLETITVTASKHGEERLQDVAASISAISTEDIERRGITGMDDYLRVMPSTYRIDLGAGRTNTVIIRGISSDPEGEDPAVSSYFGEVPLVSSVGTNADTHFGSVDLTLVDIEQIELLRGPQGTLYGAGSLAGIIRNRPAQPDADSFQAKVTAGYSNTAKNGGDNYRGEAVVNLPIVEGKFAIRAVGYSYSDSGYIKNVAATADPALAPNVANAAALGATLSNHDDIGRVDRTGGRIAVLWRPIEDFAATYTFVKQETEQSGSPEVHMRLGAYEQAYPELGPTEGGEIGDDSSVDINNLVLTYDFTWGQLLSSTSRIKTDAAYRRDISVFLPAWTQSQNGSFDEFAQEVRFASSLSGPFQFLVGGFYEDSEYKSLGRNYWSGDTALFTTLPFSLPETLAYLPRTGESHNGAEVQQESFFGEVSYQLTDGLKGTVGGRHYSYDKSINQTANYIPYFGLDARDADGKFKSTEDGNIFKAALAYKTSDNTLLYGQWSEGFRLGAPLQSDSFLPTCDPDQDGLVNINDQEFEFQPTLKSDKTSNAEIGGKFSFLDGRAGINIALYNIDWKDIPIRITSSTTGCTFTLNALEARSRGVELETEFSPAQGLKAQLALSYVDAKLTEDVSGIGKDGDRLPASPRFTASASTTYDFVVGEHDAYARLDLAYVGEFFNNLQEQGTPAGDYYQVNVRSGFNLGPLSIDVYVNNLLDADDLTYVNSFWGPGGFAYRLRPRTIGTQVNWTF